ncbi:phospholipase A2-like [Physella acuta]|uniref:phospholipase A2-like n=1 Tax=Physella acuta TaxID=109671 RepID=UPI0027DB2D0A|nr:phospholipase A2-like [Physella acuta]
MKASAAHDPDKMAVTSGHVLLLLLAAGIRCSFGDVTHHIEKRNAIQLCYVIWKHTGRSCLKYNKYGCFCGLRSAGHIPVDEADRCCQGHDQCFKQTGCHWLPFVAYAINCSGNSCTCTNSDKNSCRYKSCLCDVQLGECLKGANYNKQYKNFPTRHCTGRGLVEWP